MFYTDFDEIQTEENEQCGTGTDMCRKQCLEEGGVRS
jgi:hypothetical protein